MINPDWTEEFPGSIVVCDTEGKILAMNIKEAEYFEKQGGLDLIGTNLYDCHNKASGEMIKAMMKSGKGRTYIAEKEGKKELFIQSPWYQDGLLAGLVEIILEINEDLPIVERN